MQLALNLFLPQLASFFDGLVFFSVSSSKYHKSREAIYKELAQIKKAQKNPDDFAPIYNKYYNEIFIYVSRRVDDHELVADLTSRTFTKCLINLHNFKHMGVPFSAWLYKIAINEVRLFFRSQKSYPRTVCIHEYDIQDIVQETVDVSNIELAEKLLPKLLSSLNEIELQCIELRFFEKKSFKDIGFALGLTEVNAKVKTYRILKKLKELAVTISV
jgi:RNA polymerase sigma-70 factor (ECF subfamily)